jgi:cytochrome c peroxidase
LERRPPQQRDGLVTRLFVLVVFLAGAVSSAVPQPVSTLQANPALPAVAVPPDNPQTEAKIALGRWLFSDTRLSADDTISCASCHDPKMAWANHNTVDIGIRGRKGSRNSGTILDAAYMDFQFWDGRARTLEEQSLGPIHNPVEMGETLENVVRKLNAIEGYRTRFQAVFGTDVTADGIAKAIAAFERTVLSGPSAYDKYIAGDRSAMPQSAVRGMRLFNGKARCRTCHGGPMFSDQGFHNIGVGMDASRPDIGREAVTTDPKDRGRFKTPSLRNVALTWPYMHDGSLQTLRDVVELYDRGGVPNPTLDVFVMPLDLTDDERKDLAAFLEALTGSMPQIDRPALPK